MIATFRCRDFATEGKDSIDYKKITSKLPKESALHAWYRDSKAGRAQHRYKFGVDLAQVDVYGESGEIPIAPCRYLRFLNDTKASELLGAGAFEGFREVRNLSELGRGHRQMGWVASLRRTAEQLRSLRIGKRATKDDRIGIIEGALFEFMWQEADLQAAFLRVLENYEGLADVPEAICNEVARGAASIVNQRIDEVDRSVFGWASPHAPAVFEQLVEFWQKYGLEWLVAREVFTEFYPDRF